jgi:hypothetical protein
MKNLLVVAALVLFPLFASAQGETLLTPDGTLYTIQEQSAFSAGAANGTDSVQLLLSIRRGGEIERQIVPATLSPGVHSDAALAYDAESGMLYIFWLRYTAIMESKLLFTAIDQDGNWRDVTEFGQPFDYRQNLRIAVTRKVLGVADRLESGITVHATWWETDTHDGKESAKYAAIAIENGRVEVNFLDLTPFLENGKAADLAATREDLGALRHPVLFASPKHESVLLTFGDPATNRLNRVRIYPVRPPKSDGRIRIPVGRGEGGVGAPRFSVNANSTMNALQGNDNDNLAFYVRETSNVRYVVLRNGEWTEARTIALDEQITAPAAVEPPPGKRKLIRFPAKRKAGARAPAFLFCAGCVRSAASSASPR